MTFSTSEIALQDPDGNAATLGEFRADPLVVILVRYFGCLPCQDYLIELTRTRGRFPAAGNVIAVAGSAAYQARWLRRAKGVEIPMLLDAAERVRSIAKIGNLSPRQLVERRGVGNYLQAMRRGLPPQIPTGDALKAPGIVVFDADFSPLWVHRGQTLGDYPPVDELIELVSGLLAH